MKSTRDAVMGIPERELGRRAEPPMELCRRADPTESWLSRRDWRDALLFMAVGVPYADAVL